MEKVALSESKNLGPPNDYHGRFQDFSKKHKIIKATLQYQKKSILPNIGPLSRF